MSQAQLKEIFQFDENVLAVNRTGKLTPKQKANLSESKKGLRRILVAISIALLYLSIKFSLQVFSEGYHNDLALATSSYESLLEVLMPLLGFVVFAVFAFNLGSSKANQAVRKVEGQVHWIKTGAANNKMKVGEAVFEKVEPEFVNIAKEGDVYAFYYLKDLKTILSAEFISTRK